MPQSDRILGWYNQKSMTQLVSLGVCEINLNWQYTKCKIGNNEF